MACPVLCCANVALLAHRRWAGPSFPLFMDRYTWGGDLQTSLKNYSNRPDQQKWCAIKSFEEKWVICLRRMYGMEVSFVCAFKCCSLTCIICKWENGIGLVWKTILLIPSYILKFLSDFRCCFSLLLIFHWIYDTCSFSVVDLLLFASFAWFPRHILTSDEDCIICFSPLMPESFLFVTHLAFMFLKCIWYLFFLLEL